MNTRVFFFLLTMFFFGGLRAQTIQVETNENTQWIGLHSDSASIHLFEQKKLKTFNKILEKSKRLDSQDILLSGLDGYELWLLDQTSNIVVDKYKLNLDFTVICDERQDCYQVHKKLKKHLFKGGEDVNFTSLDLFTLTEAKKLMSLIEINDSISENFVVYGENGKWYDYDGTFILEVAVSPKLSREESKTYVSNELSKLAQNDDFSIEFKSSYKQKIRFSISSSYSLYKNIKGSNSDFVLGDWELFKMDKSSIIIGLSYLECLDLLKKD